MSIKNNGHVYYCQLPNVYDAIIPSAKYGLKKKKNQDTRSIKCIRSSPMIPGNAFMNISCIICMTQYSKNSSINFIKSMIEVTQPISSKELRYL